MPKSLQRSILALLLGAITTIVIAWAIAAWWPIGVNRPRSSIGAVARWGLPWHHVEFRQVGVRLRWWNGIADEALASPAPASAQATVEAHLTQLAADGQAGRVNMGAPFRLVREIPAWGSLAQPTPPAEDMGSDTAFGWPAPCLWYQVLSRYDPATRSIVSDQLRGGVHFRGGPPTGRGAGFYALPLRPIWWGLAINIALFTALWWIGLTAPGAIKRRRRRQRGRCPACGYDLRALRGQRCPECGAGRDVDSA